LTYELSGELDSHASAEIHVVHPLLIKYLGGEGVGDDIDVHKVRGFIFS